MCCLYRPVELPPRKHGNDQRRAGWSVSDDLGTQVWNAGHECGVGGEHSDQGEQGDRALDLRLSGDH